jgi:hypothetical protein
MVLKLNNPASDDTADNILVNHPSVYDESLNIPSENPSVAINIENEKKFC